MKTLRNTTVFLLSGLMLSFGFYATPAGAQMQRQQIKLQQLSHEQLMQVAFNFLNTKNQIETGCGMNAPVPQGGCELLQGELNHQEQILRGEFQRRGLSYPGNGSMGGGVPEDTPTQ